MAFTVADRQEYLLERDRLPQNDAAVFLETRLAGQSHYVLNEGLNRVVTIPEDQRLVQISEELWKQADAETSQIFELIAKVQEKMHRKYGKNGQALVANLRSISWSDVLGQIGSTAQQWSESRKASNMSVLVDKIGRNSEAFQSWLQVLPSGDYGASITGVFSIAISAASHRYKVEEAIFEGLAEVPEIMDGAKRYIKIYSETRYSNLERRTFDLYLSILRFLRHILKFFAESSAKRIYEPILKQSSYQQDLHDNLERIKIQVERVKEEANQCSQERLRDIEGNLLGFGDLMQTVQDESSQNATLLQAMYRLLQTAIVERSSPGQQNSRQGIGPSPTSGGNLVEAPPNYTQGRRLLRLLRPDISSRDSGSHSSADKDDHANEFLEKTKREVKSCLGDMGIMTPRTASKAAELMQREEFKTFMDMSERTGSDYLLVNGHGMDGEHGPSPLTFLSAKLYQIASNLGSERPYILGYFCDEHRPFSIRGSETCKPVGMVLSLLGQLIAQMMTRGVPVDLSYLDDDDWKKIRKRKLKTLGELLQRLVTGLSSSSKVYCVIDEVAHYEQPGMDDDLGKILYRLTKIAAACKGKRRVPQEEGVEFKLLVTTRREARVVGTIFEGHTVDLTEVVEPRDSSQTVIESLGKGG